MEALIPLGGSKTKLLDSLINVGGILGLNSIVKNNLKFLFGDSLFNFFSTSLNHLGAK